MLLVPLNSTGAAITDKPSFVLTVTLLNTALLINIAYSLFQIDKTLCESSIIESLIIVEPLLL